jgi:hopanoid C-3 methylase
MKPLTGCSRNRRSSRMTLKKVLLVKCHKKTIFSRLEPIITEPLELEYLAASLKKLGIEYKIYDPLLEGGSFRRVYDSYEPDILALSGYITAVEIIKEYSAYAKQKNPQVKVVVGGVHAEVNYEDFFNEFIDVVVHSGGAYSFEKLIKTDFNIEKLQNLEGIAFMHEDGFKVNKKVYTNAEDILLPDRGYFNSYKHRTKYLNYGPVAIIKTALSCPFSCSFCYCKQLNMGKYSARTIEAVVKEIAAIDCEHLWIVDDSFLIDRKRVARFIELIEESSIKKKFIAYSRADFISKNEDLIEKLSSIGFIDLIVGMEAVDDSYLTGFNKNVRADENMKAARILERHGINLTALFIAGIDFTVKDFKNLRSWIRKMGLKLYTLSIFTPMKGLKNFDEYRSKLLTEDYSKWDFLHLVIRPEKMSIAGFYFQFYLSYAAQFFSNREVRNLIYKRVGSLFKTGGHNA